MSEVVYSVSEVVYSVSEVVYSVSEVMYNVSEMMCTVFQRPVLYEIFSCHLLHVWLHGSL